MFWAWISELQILHPPTLSLRQPCGGVPCLACPQTWEAAEPLEELEAWEA